jgi:hypothetical protein
MGVQNFATRFSRTPPAVYWQTCLFLGSFLGTSPKPPLQILAFGFIPGFDAAKS